LRAQPAKITLAERSAEGCAEHPYGGVEGFLSDLADFATVYDGNPNSCEVFSGRVKRAQKNHKKR
jgi:hypothetical protein